ncbi:MAG: MFS transporter [Caldilineaceae bacterium]
MRLQQSSTTQATLRSDGLVNRTPIYYGWVILVIATFGSIMTSPGQTYAVSIFIEQFIQELDISRALVSTLYTAGTLGGSLALPLVGRQLDRRGARFMGTVVALAFGGACIYMGYVQNALMLGLGFLAIRMLGQGSLSMICTNVINQWWVRRRGPLLGLSGLAMALLGVGGFPNLINWLIPLYGWRTTYMLLGIVLLVVFAPVVWLFLRNRPEEYGLLPDGVPTVQRPTQQNLPLSATVQPSLVEENWTLAEAMRTPIFWVFNLGLASISMLGTGLMFHIVSIFDDNGMSATVAAAAFVPVAITTALTNLGSGFLVDRVRLRVLLAWALVMQTISLWMVPYLGTVALAMTFGISLGITNGLQRTVNTVAWAKYYGRLHLGSISGVTSTVLVGASALGPMPMGVARDLLGSYGPTLKLLAVIPLVLALTSLFVDRPAKRKEPTHESHS